MLSPEQLKTYDVISGNLNPEVAYEAVIAHCHFIGDTTSRVRRMVHAAADAGIDQLSVTDHDSIRGHERVTQTIERYGYNMKMVPGIEVTARGTNNTPRHVLVYGADQPPPPGLSVGDLNQWAHEQQGVQTAVAHPELWKFSVTAAELNEIQAHPDPTRRFDAGEIYNGAVARYEASREQYPRLTRFLERLKMIPPTGANKIMQSVVEQHQRLPALGGSDAHEWDGVAHVVNLVPKGQDIFTAANERTVVILAKKQEYVTGIPLWRHALAAVKGTVIERQHERRARRAIRERATFIP